MDLEKTKRYYSSLSNDDLEELILFDLHELRSEALPILQHEVGNRKSLAKDFENILEIYSVGREHPEVQKLVSRIRHMPCPVCGSKDGKLNGANIIRIVGMLFVSARTEKTIIACSTCISEKAREFNLSNFIIGWWAFPMGLFNNIGAIRNNLKYYDLEIDSPPSEYFSNLIERNLVTLFKNYQKDEDLWSLLQQPHYFRELNARKAYVDNRGL